MPVNRKQYIALWIVAVEILLNIVIRPFDHRIYLGGNIICLILLSFAALLVAEKFEKVLAIIVSGCMIGLLPDTFLFTPNIIGLNDYITWGGSIAAACYFMLRASIKPAFNGNVGILLLALLIRLYVPNTDMQIGGRYVFFMGDSVTHLLFAAFIWRKVFRNYQVVPLWLLALTFSNMQDEVTGDPVHLHLNEIFLVCYLAILSLWWIFGKHYLHPKTFMHTIILFHILLLVFGLGIEYF